MARVWPILLPIPVVGWWLLGFPPGWGWLVAPMLPAMPISVGGLIVVALVLVGMASAIRLALDNL
jgi:hypothetical protein